MSRNGSGTYNLPAGNPVVPATIISTTWANTTLNDMAAALTGSVAADGQTPVTGDLQMSSHKILALATCTAATDAANKSYVDAAIVTATGTLGTMSTQNANNVAITGGTITGLSSALPVASGGTGVTTSTGSGANVLGTSPTIATPTITGNITDGTYTTSVAATAQGTAKAWVNYKGTSTRAINASYNVSSVTYNSTGNYTINFTNAFADANYASIGTCQTTASFAVVLKLATTGQTTSTSNIITAYESGGSGQDLVVDSALICMAFFR